jgi:putative hydrolase of the HAD superfamily
VTSGSGPIHNRDGYSSSHGNEDSKSERIRGVLFDATGTLFDTRESIGTVYARHAAPHGVDLPSWRLDDAFARVLAAAPPRVFPDCEASEITHLEQQWWRNVVRSSFRAADSTLEFDDFSSFFSELYAYYETAEAWALRPGTRHVLSELKRRGFRTGVVSNFDQRLPIILQALDIDEFLDLVMTPAQCRAEKPDGRIFEAALQALKLPAAVVIYVGDDPEKDRAAAVRAGMQCLDPDAFEAYADFIHHVESMKVLCPDRVSDSASDEAR